MTKADFLDAKAIYLPEHCRWENIISQPENIDLGEYLNKAMRNIESEYEDLEGVIPKNYKLFEKDLLQNLIRIFNDEVLDDMPGDTFGQIYEYFLNNLFGWSSGRW